MAMQERIIYDCGQHFNYVLLFHLLCLIQQLISYSVYIPKI